MKYYLIKDEFEELEVDRQSKELCVNTSEDYVAIASKKGFVELTEEELQAIANEKIHLTSSSDYINGCDKLRKVLE